VLLLLIGSATAMVASLLVFEEKMNTFELVDLLLLLLLVAGFF